MSKLMQIYPKLTDRECSILAFEAVAKGTEPHRDSIRDDSFEFMEHGQQLTNLGLYYGVQYWRTRCMLLTTDEHTMVKSLLVQLGSMEVALSGVCDWLKVDVESVKAVSGCDDEPVLDDADPEQVKQYSQTFMELFV